MNPPETRVTQILEALGIPYRRLPHSEPVYTVEAAAAQRGVVLEEMIKSILLRDRDKRFVLACVPGSARLDPKAVRMQLPAGWKRLHFASAAEIEAVTGCVKGAISPLGLPAHVPVIFDVAIAGFEKVNISSGDPMLGLELLSRDLIAAANATLARITEAQ